MIRLIPALAAALVAATAITPVPAAADAAAQVRAMVADITGRPVRQVRATTATRAATPVRASAIVAMARTGDAETMVMRTIGGDVPRAAFNLAPLVSLRPMARPGNLALAFSTRCGGVVDADAPRVCAQPLSAAQTAATAQPLAFADARPAMPEVSVIRPSSPSGHAFIITDGRLRSYAVTR